ncbi:LOW QUALITY PROTEIN: ephrin-A1-like [Heptranchias perlo]|uniref:LOW QUALITY PROTEIN: ephrin-A1-like n=1 Tax=Heptranchias perlo TaxID=212740 RepID=UPI00355A858B
MGYNFTSKQGKGPNMSWKITCAVLCWTCALMGQISAERYTLYWNTTNTKLLKDDYTLEVKLNDYLDILCPHYAETVLSHATERYTLYLVTKEDFESCKPKSKDQVRWECRRPHAPHGPERFSEKFQRFTPFSLGKEFKESHYYYYISKAIHHHGEQCLKLRIYVCCRKKPASDSGSHTINPIFQQTSRGGLPDTQRSTAARLPWYRLKASLCC